MQTRGALIAIRLLMAPVPALLLAAACVVAWFYPLTRKHHAEVQAELALRRRTRNGLYEGTHAGQ